MQRLETIFGKPHVEEMNKQRVKKIEDNLRDSLKGEEAGYLFVCPVCNYQSKKNRKGSAKIFEDNKSRVLKCFSCGIWRRL